MRVSDQVVKIMNCAAKYKQTTTPGDDEKSGDPVGIYAKNNL